MRFFKTDEMHQPTDSRSSVNLKQDKDKATLCDTSKPAKNKNKNKRIILKAVIEKRHIILKQQQ